ncbi:MAG TPA: Xaa-Pro peptidase family protein [Woeseiaceae bacterium]|jgi:Xaa-Pro dipeptidase|nr:Xaa-Pro peptidase family protein [Woeseiaceae bacterium]
MTDPQQTSPPVEKPSAANGLRFFTDEEFEERIERVRARIAERELEAVVITNPENIYYLTGLNHQGYFAYTSLILPLAGKPVLIMRAMEKAITRDMVVPTVAFYPYSDGVEPLPKATYPGEDIRMSIATGEPELGGLGPSSMSLGVSVHANDERDPDLSAPVQATCRALSDLGLSQARVAFEKNSSFLPYKTAEGFITRTPGIDWSDASDLINDCRIVQSPAEVACTRRAAKISDAMVMSGIAMAGPDVPNRDVAAIVYHTMIQRGGTYPAFVPLIRSTRTLDHEHGTWDSDTLSEHDLLFLEMSGCYWRYHAPVGRLAHIGVATPGSARASGVCLEAQLAAAEALKPGVTADSVYQAWKRCIDKAGFDHYHRHHCGYLVGIGFPPSWSGSGVPRGLRKGSDMIIEQGMAFHLMSWLMRTGQGDAFLSDTVIVTEDGCEFLTEAPRDLTIR